MTMFSLACWNEECIRFGQPQTVQLQPIPNAYCSECGGRLSAPPLTHSHEL